MKAYQIKIELAGSDPLIWRRVVMPAGATFNRLHDVIQNVTNFQGGYPGSYHLFEFDLPDDHIRVTNDEEAYQEHQHFKKNRKEMEARILDVPEKFKEMAEARLQDLETVIRKPTGLKIDTYLETYRQLSYIYDYGDGWHFLITLEKTVEDYHYGYPVLIEGAETAPPEDVGGLPGYDMFLKIYHDVNHPEHEDMTAWAKEQLFREYDPDFINDRLKSIHYKKTEWDQINKQ